MKKMLFVAAFAAMASAATVKAQATDRPEGGRRGPGRGGMMMDSVLFKGITLSDAQKTQIEKLRADERAKMEAMRGQAQPGSRPDFQKMRDERIASLRSILSADQQKQFDANAAEMKQRMANGRGGRGQRSQNPRG